MFKRTKVISRRPLSLQMDTNLMSMYHHVSYK